MVKIWFLDLSNLRFGIFINAVPMPNVDGKVIVKYRPVNSLFAKEIPGIPEQSLLDIGKTELGNLSDAEHFKIMLVGERGESDFLDKILPYRYGDLIQKLQAMKKELEIRRGVMESKSIEISKDILSELKRFEDVIKTYEKFVKPKRELFPGREI